MVCCSFNYTEMLISGENVTNRLIAILGILLAGFQLSACATPGVVSVVQPITVSPGSLVVIPSSGDDSAVKFSGSVERALLRFGLQVVERPVYKFIDAGGTRNDSSQTANGGAGGAQGTNITTNIMQRPNFIDIVSMYDDTKADTIVVTYWEDWKGRIRIIRRKDRTVIGVANFTSDLDYKWEMDNLFTALIAAGIVKSPGTEMRCQTIAVPEPKK